MIRICHRVLINASKKSSTLPERSWWLSPNNSSHVWNRRKRILPDNTPKIQPKRNRGKQNTTPGDPGWTETILAFYGPIGTKLTRQLFSLTLPDLSGAPSCAGKQLSTNFWSIRKMANVSKRYRAGFCSPPAKSRFLFGTTCVKRNMMIKWLFKPGEAFSRAERSAFQCKMN